MPLSIDLASPRLAVHRHHVCARVCVRATEARDFLYGSKSMSFLGKKKGRIRISSHRKESIFLLLSLYKDRGWNRNFFFLNKKLIKIIETFGWKLINYSEEEINHCYPFELENLKMKRLDIVRGDCHRETKGIVSVFFLRNTWRRGGKELCQPVLQPPQHIVREACRGGEKRFIKFFIFLESNDFN